MILLNGKIDQEIIKRQFQKTHFWIKTNVKLKLYIQGILPYIGHWSYSNAVKYNKYIQRLWKANRNEENWKPIHM